MEEENIVYIDSDCREEESMVPWDFLRYPRGCAILGMEPTEKVGGAMEGIQGVQKLVLH